MHKIESITQDQLNLVAIHADGIHHLWLKPDVTKDNTAQLTTRYDAVRDLQKLITLGLLQEVPESNLEVSDSLKAIEKDFGRTAYAIEITQMGLIMFGEASNEKKKPN